MKRALDVVIAGAGLLLFSPVFMVVGAVVAWKLGLPILYARLRPGLHGRPFKMLKFRTMTEEFDADGVPLPDALRLTPAGRVLRSASLDELPQLLNVLRGDMSIVGPRPLLTEYLERYTPEQARRHEVRPGITGWAQVHGRNALPWEERLALDTWYVDNRTLALDLRIMLLTLARVVTRRGVSAPGSETMPPFTGNEARTGDE